MTIFSLARFKQLFESCALFFALSFHPATSSPLLVTARTHSPSTSLTRERILDAAESLFADRGFRAVSLREITAKADANLAAVNYHFGGKDGLIYEVLMRVVGPINEERLVRLDAAEAESGVDPVPLRVVLDAFFRPVVDQLANAGHQSTVYLKLAGRCLAEGEEQPPETLLRLFEKVAHRFISAARRSLPDGEEADIYWGFHFSIGALLRALTKGTQLTLFSRGTVHDSSPEETLDRLIEFTAAGIEGQARRSKLRRGAGVAVLVSALGLLFTSCTSVSPENVRHLARAETPVHWVAGPTYRPVHFPDTFWVEQFHDPSLTAYVRDALAHNRDLAEARARIEIAAASARIAGADLYPQIGGSFSGQRQKQNFIGFPIPGAQGGNNVLSTRFNQFGLSLDMSWEVDLWGRIRAAESAAIAEFEASEFDRATAELSLAGQAVKAWVALAEARDQVTLARATVGVFRDTESAIRDRFESGIAEQGQTSLASQLLLAQADVATAEDTVAAREELVGRTARQLEILAGRYPAGREGRDAHLPSFPSRPPTGLPATLLDRRPDLAAAERRIAAADQRLLEAKRALLPSLSLSTSTGTVGAQISDILDSNFSVWSLAGNLAQPILQGGRLRANVARRDAELLAAAAEFEQAALTAFAEVENALAAEKYFERRLHALTEAVFLSDEANARARQEYESGTGDLLTVLTAQQTAFTRKSQLLSLKRLRIENRVDLYLALGGSFRPHAAPASKAPDSSDSTPPSRSDT